MRNSFSGYCYYCTHFVAKGAGHFEKLQNAKGFRVIHADCVFKQREEKQKANGGQHEPTSP